ncbi:MAG: type II toxin-antitoxin system RelE/ParE family toxin [Stellaceae bacterium]
MIPAALAPRARRDLLAAVRWIAADNPAAARALRDAVAKAAQRIGEHPHIGSARPELANAPYRFMPLTGFPYILVYNANRSPPLIIRILHGARDLPDILRDL